MLVKLTPELAITSKYQPPAYNGLQFEVQSFVTFDNNPLPTTAMFTVIPNRVPQGDARLLKFIEIYTYFNIYWTKLGCRKPKEE